MEKAARQSPLLRDVHYRSGRKHKHRLVFIFWLINGPYISVQHRAAQEKETKTIVGALPSATSVPIQKLNLKTSSYLITILPHTTLTIQWLSISSRLEYDVQHAKNDHYFIDYVEPFKLCVACQFHVSLLVLLPLLLLMLCCPCWCPCCCCCYCCSCCGQGLLQHIADGASSLYS